MQSLTLTRPDDWHLHLRDGAAMGAVVAHTAERFGRAIIMPNLVPPVTTVAAALEYRQRILDVVPGDLSFNPLMTLYLTSTTTPEEIERARDEEHVVAVKLYPAGATTNSDAGVSSLEPLTPVFQAMARVGLPLLIHGETTAASDDVFDRESIFVESTLSPLVERFPGLHVVLEHITTARAVEFVERSRDGVAATITAHHLLLNRNAIFQGGIQPHHYCLPILKRERDREALLRAATSGNPKFFLGTDSAPHRRDRKESSCGCAGIYTAHAAIELYAEAFEIAGALAKLEDFASRNGPAFYGLEPNADTITLVKRERAIPPHYAFDGGELVPMRASGTTAWSLGD
jgi:dihydroorotase